MYKHHECKFYLTQDCNLHHFLKLVERRGSVGYNETHFGMGMASAIKYDYVERGADEKYALSELGKTVLSTLSNGVGWAIKGKYALTEEEIWEREARKD